MSLKKVRGGVTGFGDTLVSKTMPFFFLGSHVRGGGGSLYLVFYGICNNAQLSPSSGFVAFPGAIPPNEIWIKAGGVKGGGIFKFCLKLLNVEAPNSSEKTSVISMFEGPDSVTNMHICLDQYVEQLAEINQMTWRYSLTL